MSERVNIVPIGFSELSGKVARIIIKNKRISLIEYPFDVFGGG